MAERIKEKKAVLILQNRIENPNYPLEAPKPDSVPHPETSPPEFPQERPILDPPAGDFLL
ncbi:hypothetical protein SEF58_11325 [Neomoorella humiferrea]